MSLSSSLLTVVTFSLYVEQEVALIDSVVAR